MIHHRTKQRVFLYVAALALAVLPTAMSGASTPVLPAHSYKLAAHHICRSGFNKVNVRVGKVLVAYCEPKPIKTVVTTTTVAKKPVATATTIPTLYSPAGNLYRAGEFCSTADLGIKDNGSDGEIQCVNDAGYNRWTKV